MDLYIKEQFGPVVPVCANQDEQEFLDYVTQSNYGQQVSLFGRDPDKFVKLIDPLANQVCRDRPECPVPARAGYAAFRWEICGICGLALIFGFWV